MKISLNIRRSIVLLILIVSIGGVYLTSTPSQNIARADALEDRIKDVKDAEDPNTLLGSIVEISSYVAGLSLVGLGVYAGFLMITSQGNPEKLSEAREVLSNAVIGFAFIALSVAILLIIESLLDLPMT